MHDAPSEHHDESAKLRRELMIARDAVLGAQAERATLAARVAELEGKVANLTASNEEMADLLLEFGAAPVRPLDRVRARLTRSSR